MGNKKASSGIKSKNFPPLAKHKTDKEIIAVFNELIKEEAIKKTKETQESTMEIIPQGPPLKKNETTVPLSRLAILQLNYPKVDNSEKIKGLRNKRKEEGDDYDRSLVKWCEKRLGWSYEASKDLELYIKKGSCNSNKLKELQELDKEERYNNELLRDWQREERGEYEKEVKRVKKELKIKSGEKSQYSKYEPIILRLIKEGDLEKKQVICKKIYKAIKEAGFNKTLENDLIPISTLNNWLRIMTSNNRTSIYKISALTSSKV